MIKAIQILFFSSNMTKYKGGHSGPHVREIQEKRVCVK